MEKHNVCKRGCVAIGFILVFGCSNIMDKNVAEKEAHVQEKNGGAPAYNLTAPETITLPAQLSEISGISYSDKESAVYAIHDESENLFKFSLQNNPSVSRWSLGKKADYEELFIDGNTAYVLESKGSILSFPLSFPISKTAEATLDIAGKNEFEIMFKDPSANRLLMMCKECKGDGKGEVSVYAFDLATKNFQSKAVATLKRKDIETALKGETDRFKPSAAAVHPQTGEVYIISSINKLLVVTDGSFKVKEVHKLDPGIFKQPEGLAFTTNGDILVANEAAETGNPNIMIFRSAKK